MAKKKRVFICGSCGHEEHNWLGRCPECGNWNTFTEVAAPEESGKTESQEKRRGRAGKKPALLSELEPDPQMRISSGISEMDNVLGGGIMKGGAVLIGGEPGIGKSTILLQMLSRKIEGSKKSLYISGEESAGQIRIRAERLGLSLNTIHVLCETRLHVIERTLREQNYDLVVIDSIQTLVSPEAGNVAGTVNQVKYCSLELVETAKIEGISLFLVGHVTKDGSLAGPKSIEHLVDTVLYFDHAEDGVRILRAGKNRFGSVDEIGVFTMTDKGLMPAGNPESFFLSRRKGTPPAGVVAAAVFEGSRTFMVEIQALTVPAKSGYSRINSDRIDSARVSRVAAILEKHVGLTFSDNDIYVNVAGGIRVSEVGIELPLAFALFSARTGKALKRGLASAGELSLAGEVRTISHIEKRLSAADQMGFTEFAGPDIHDPASANALKGSIYSAFSTLRDAVTYMVKQGQDT